MWGATVLEPVSSSPAHPGHERSPLAERPDVCRLADDTGGVLSTGILRPAAIAPGAVLAITHLDRPGDVVRRCLLGDLRGVQVLLANGEALPAVVERVFYEPGPGRVCIVRLGELV
jgi:hypothetical protein